MDPELRGISDHMMDVSLGVLSQAQRNLCYADYVPRLDEGVFGVLQAAHSCELLIKAAIAKEHPLLIFSQLPSLAGVPTGSLDFQMLLEKGKTLQYNELPERLWAVTGYRIVRVDLYKAFGQLRNAIQHFAVPDEDLRIRGTEFIYSVIDPILEHFWGHYAVEYCDLEEHEDDFFEILLERGITPRCPAHLQEFAEKAIDRKKNESSSEIKLPE